MENNTNLPTIAEAVGNAVDDIKVPSVDSIGEMPTVELPSVDAINPAAPQPIQTVQADQPTQPIQMTPPVEPVQPTAPTYTQPAAPTYAQPTAPTYAQPTAPTYAQPTAPTYAQPAAQTYTLPATNYQIPTQNNGKRSVGQIVSLIFGILITLFFAFCTFAVAVYDIDTYNTEGQVDVEMGVYIVLLIPLLIGILLIWLGARKKKNNAVSAPTATYAPAAASYTTPASQGYVVPPMAASTATASTATIPTATAPTVTAPVSGTAAETAPQTLPTTAPVTNTADYQYAATAMIGDDSDKVARKSARNSGLLAIGCIVIMWVLVFALDLLSWYLLIIPFILSFRAIKTCVKSPAGWFGMVLSVLSTIVLILLVIAANAM